MKIAIRIIGQVRVKQKQRDNLDSLLLRRKYNAIILQEDELPRLNKIRELITFGDIDDSTLKEVLTKRGRKNKKELKDVDKIIVELKKGNSLKKIGITPFLALHPPRGGFKKSTKLPCPQGILGKNKDINLLVRRML